MREPGSTLPRDVGQAAARPGYFPPWRRHRRVETAHPAGADSLWQVSRVSWGHFYPSARCGLTPQASSQSLWTSVPPLAPPPAHTLFCGPGPLLPTAKLALIPTRPPGASRWAPRRGRPCRWWPTNWGQPSLPGLEACWAHPDREAPWNWGWGWRRVPQVPESVVRVLRAGASRAWVWVGSPQRPGEQGPFPSPRAVVLMHSRRCCSLRPPLPGGMMTVEKARTGSQACAEAGGGGGGRPPAPCPHSESLVTTPTPRSAWAITLPREGAQQRPGPASPAAAVESASSAAASRRLRLRL